MSKAAPIFMLAVLFLSTLPSRASGQEETADTRQSQEPLRVFLDCERFICDSYHFRREVDFISYVRDRMDAELHVLVTSQPTGAGGEGYSFFFIGLTDREGAQDTPERAQWPAHPTRPPPEPTASSGVVRKAPKSVGVTGSAVFWLEAV